MIPIMKDHKYFHNNNLKEDNPMKKLSKRIISICTLCLLLAVELGATALAAGGTGPYRRVSSNAGTKSQPYTYMETTVTLPSKSNIKENGKDTAYVYIGGSGNGTEIDAGLQHSPTYDNWAPIINCNSVYSHPSDTDRFKGGQTVKMVFYVSADNKVVLQVSGTTDKGQYKTITTYCNTATGWKANGIGNTMKRVTSIGQSPENLSSGSYILGVKWANSYIGTTSSKHQWLANDTLASGSICYPNKTKVTVNYVNAGEETVSIDLR